MRALEQRPLSWIDEAPVSIAAHATSTAPPDAVFAELADHERWPEWFPAVREVTVIGAREGVGARRRVRIPGSVVEEEFIAWEQGRRWSFTGTAARPRFTRSLVEDCQLEPTADGGTVITYTMYLDPPPLLRPLMAVAARGIKANNQKAMTALARRAAAR